MLPAARRPKVWERRRGVQGLVWNVSQEGGPMWRAQGTAAAVTLSAVLFGKLQSGEER